ncbi:MAG: DUF1854 domain-containing protein [Firmicutes bacterium]|nr:DUF1854 domain-containing protein [Bacillota bacterium]
MAANNKEKDELLDDGLGELDNVRVSVDLTPANARFYRSEGNLISLELTGEDGKVEKFERVVALRAFPMSNLSEFISIRAVSPHKTESGKEIGMIRRLSDFDEETGKIVTEELNRRYFIPEVFKINSVKEKFGYHYLDIVTSAGEASIIIGSPFTSIRLLETTGCIMISDMDGGQYIIPDPKKIDQASYKKIEIFL